MDEGTRKVNRFGEIAVLKYGSVAHWSANQTYHVALSALKENHVKQNLSRHTLSYLEKAIKFYNVHNSAIAYGTKSFDVYADGIKECLREEMPVGWGKLPKAGPEVPDPQRLTYAGVIESISSFRHLHADSRLFLMREVSGDPALSRIPGQSGNIKTIENVLESYDRNLRTNGRAIADSSIRARSITGGTILDLVSSALKKSYLPNFSDFFEERIQRERS